MRPEEMLDLGRVTVPAELVSVVTVYVALHAVLPRMVVVPPMVLAIVVPLAITFIVPVACCYNAGGQQR